MTIKYTGTGVSLTAAPQVLASVPSGSKSANVVHVQLTNLDHEFKRTLNYWLSVSGGRNMVIAECVGVPYGETPQFSGISLNPGESLNAYAETVGLLNASTSLGVQV